jgi:hypothetical protein
VKDPLEPLCRRALVSRSKFAELYSPRCHEVKGHAGACSEFPFLEELGRTHPRVAQKIKRDATMTTGAAWKSADAGPNRILRWVMLENDARLAEFGLNMQELKAGVVAKLREKAATYDDCIRVAIALLAKAYKMPAAPQPSQEVRQYLELTGLWDESSTTCCEVCLIPIDFGLFENAQRGKAEVETCHKDPRQHTPENVGFAHRECNIAQGAKNLPEFYNWIRGIIKRVDACT